MQCYNISFHEFSNWFSVPQKKIRNKDARSEVKSAQADAHRTLGGLLFNKGEIQKGIDESEKGLAIVRIQKPGSLGEADLLADIGSGLFKQSKFMESLKYLEQADEIYSKADCPSSTNVGICLYTMGTIYKDMGKVDKALEYNKKARAAIQASPDPESMYMSRVLHNIGQLYGHKGKQSEADKYFQEALRIQMEITNGKGCLETAALMRDMACLGGNLESGESKDLQREAKELLQKHAPNDWRRKAEQLHYEGVSKAVTNQYPEALELFEKAYKILKKKPPSIELSRTLRDIADTLVQSKPDDVQSLNKALAHCKEAQAITDEKISPNSYFSSRHRLAQARVLSHLGRDKEAYDQLLEVINLDCKVRRDAPLKTDTYNFFDFVGHTRLLFCAAEFETKVQSEGDDNAIIDRFRDEAEQAREEGSRILQEMEGLVGDKSKARRRQTLAEDRYTVAFLYLGLATRIAHSRNKAQVPRLLALQSELYAKVPGVEDWLFDCPEHSWVLRERERSASTSDASTDVSDPPKISCLHQDLEALKVSFIELQCDYHRSLANNKETHCSFAKDEDRSLTAQNENRTAEFFVSFLNLLDKIYAHWIQATLKQKGIDDRRQHLFPVHSSQADFESAARDGKYWAVVRQSMFESNRDKKDFVSLSLMDGLLEAGYLDKKKQWTLKAEKAATKCTWDLPWKYSAFIPALKEMQRVDTIKTGCRPKSIKQLIVRKKPLQPLRWVELLKEAGICENKNNRDVNGKVYANIDKPQIKLDHLLTFAKDAKEREAIEYFYPQVHNWIQPRHGIQIHCNILAFV